MEIEIVSEEGAREQLLKGDFSLQLITELSDYFNRTLLDTVELLCKEYFSGETGNDVILIKEDSKVVAVAAVFIDYNHVHTGCRTLVAEGLYGLKDNKVARKKLLKALYVHAQYHQCTHLQTQQFVGYKGHSMRFIGSIRKLIGDSNG